MIEDALPTYNQENILTLLCYDDVNGRIVANMVQDTLFEGSYVILVDRVLAYWKQYDRAPRAHTADLVQDILSDPDNPKAPEFAVILRQIVQFSEQINPPFVIDNVQRFIHYQNLKGAMLKGADELLAKGPAGNEAVEDIWNRAIRTRALSFEPGLSMLDYPRMLAYMDTRYSDFRTGIKHLDERQVVPARASVTLFLAGTGKGKSWFLVNVGVQALMQGLRVAHVSCEMESEEVLQRYYQTRFTIPKRRAEAIQTISFKVNRDQRLEDFVFDKMVPDFALDDERTREAELEVRARRYEHSFRRIRIKKFPMRSLTMDGLNAYLDNLERVEHFMPDMLILDYIGVTKTDMKQHRLGLGRNMEEFHGICDARKLAGVTAQQTNKLGYKAKSVGLEHVAEDWSLTNSADNVLLYSSTVEEHRRGLARLFVGKSRSEQDGFGVLLAQNYQTGQFCTESVMLEGPEYWKLTEDFADDPVSEEDDDNY